MIKSLWMNFNVFTGIVNTDFLSSPTHLLVSFRRWMNCAAGTERRVQLGLWDLSWALSDWALSVSDVHTEAVQAALAKHKERKMAVPMPSKRRSLVVQTSMDAYTPPGKGHAPRHGLLNVLGTSELTTSPAIRGFCFQNNDVVMQILWTRSPKTVLYELNVEGKVTLLCICINTHF